MNEYDFIVVGSGAGGLSAALKAAKHGRVAIVTKKKRPGFELSLGTGRDRLCAKSGRFL